MPHDKDPQPLVLLLSELPEQLETPRLVIRVARPGDGVVFNEAVLESLPQLSPWLGWVTPAPTLQESELNCRRAYARWLLNEDLMAFFFLRGEEEEENEGRGGHAAVGPLIGGSGLHKADWTLRQFEVGYWSRTRFGGSGLMTEGVKALADHALERLGASRVFLTCDDRNQRSWRLAERAGFQLEGVLRNERKSLAGDWRDTRVYARVGVGVATHEGDHGRP